MKRIFTIFLALFAASSVWAEFEVDGMYYYTISENEVEVANHWWDEDYYYGDIVIPSSVTYGGNNYNVTSIGEYAFVNCTGLTSITIPESVTTIGDYAFRSCFGLTSITIPSSVTSIGTDAFEYCSGLTSITIPDGLDVSDARIYFTKNDKKYQVKNSKEVAVTGYDYYESIKYTGDIIIPSTVTAGNTYSVTSIEERAFYECHDLTSVTIPNSVTSIGTDAFAYCSKVIIVYSGSAEGSPWGANTVCGAKDENFIYKDAEKTIISKYIGTSGDVVIPNSVTSIGEYAFWGCSGLTSVTIPNTITTIGENAFSGCTGLTSIIIPNSVTSIGSSAFSGCSGLTSITIPNGVTSIGIAAFFDCSGLTSITIPNSVTTIGEMAFEECNVLNSVTLPDNLDVSNVEIRVTKDGIRYQILNDKKVKVVFKYNESYTGDVVIPASISAGNTFTVTSIGDWAFNKCVNLTSVTIPNSVTSIGTSAFEECFSLTSVTIPNSVTSIGERTFYSCSKLTNVTCLAPTPPEACSEAYSNSFENYNGYLYIPCVNKEDYENDACWGAFKHIECIGSEPVELTKDEVAVVPEKTEAVFSMPKNENANTYTLTISNNGVTFCTLTFNAQGQLANIDFSTNKSYELKSGVEAFQFTVTGLSTASDYGYSFKALASNKSVLKEYSGSFTTKNEDGTGGSVQGGGEGSDQGSQGGEGGEGGSTAVSEVSNTTAVTVVNDQILVNGEAPAFVVTVSGQKIANANLKSGVYFVVAEGETVKIVVR